MKHCQIYNKHVGQTGSQEYALLYECFVASATLNENKPLKSANIQLHPQGRWENSGNKSIICDQWSHKVMGRYAPTEDKAFYVIMKDRPWLTVLPLVQFSTTS